MTFFNDKIWTLWHFLAVMTIFKNFISKYCFQLYGHVTVILSWSLVVLIFQRHGPQRDPQIETKWNKRHDNCSNFKIGVYNKTWQKANTVVMTDYIIGELWVIHNCENFYISFGEIVLILVESHKAWWKHYRTIAESQLPLQNHHWTLLEPLQNLANDFTCN